MEVVCRRSNSRRAALRRGLTATVLALPLLAGCSNAYDRGEACEEHGDGFVCGAPPTTRAATRP